MFNKKFNELEKKHPERFEYDFEAPRGRDTAAREAQINALLPESARKRLAKKNK